MIIVEGPDGGGKSTVIRFIQAAFPEYQVIHSPGPLHVSNLKERLFWNWELCRINHIIFDRCTFFSEYVYGPILRNASLIEYSDIIDFVMNFQKTKGNLIVFCNQIFSQTRETVSLNHTEVEQEALNDQVELHIDEIRAMYNQLFLRLSSDHQHFNYCQINNTLDFITLLEKVRKLKDEH